MTYETYIVPEMMVLIPVLYGLGRVLKETICPDRYIPAVLTIISVLITALYIFSDKPVATTQETAQAIFTALTQGILIASASVYTNEAIKQATKKDEQ